MQKKIAEVDVNIVPLLVNQFTNCKSELKYFEAGIVGTITCASPSFTYQKAISHGVNGYLCNSDEWFDTLMKIYEEGVSPEKMTQISKVCLEQYSYLNQLDLIENTLDKIVKISNGL